MSSRMAFALSSTCLTEIAGLGDVDCHVDSFIRMVHDPNLTAIARGVGEYIVNRVLSRTVNRCHAASVDLGSGRPTEWDRSGQGPRWSGEAVEFRHLHGWSPMNDRYLEPGSSEVPS